MLSRKLILCNFVRPADGARFRRTLLLQTRTPVQPTSAMLVSVKSIAGSQAQAAPRRKYFASDRDTRR
jgi:hypothetical protein